MKMKEILILRIVLIYVLEVLFLAVGLIEILKKNILIAVLCVVCAIYLNLLGLKIKKK
jgi:hypothetical protein